MKQYKNLCRGKFQ